MRTILAALCVALIVGCAPIKPNEIEGEFLVLADGKWWNAGTFRAIGRPPIIIVRGPAVELPRGCEETGDRRMLYVATTESMTRWREGRLLACQEQEVIRIIDWHPEF